MWGRKSKPVEEVGAAPAVAASPGLVRIFTATSADGFIADHDGSTEWLAGFDPGLYGFDTFVDGVGSVVLGRRTYEFTLAFDDWPYGDKHAFVLTSRPLPGARPGLTPVAGGMAAALAAARAATSGDIWIVGGAMTMRSALEAGVVDAIDLFLVPTLLGSGLSLIDSLPHPVKLALDSIETFADGVVKISYRLKPAAGSAA